MEAAYKPWEQLTAEEKTERLHHDLTRFIEHANEQSVIQSHMIEAMKAHLATIEAELKKLATRLARLER